MAEDYRNDNMSDMQHMRRDVRDAHSDASAAKLLATLAMIGTLISLGFSIAAWNKANDALGNSQRAFNTAREIQ
jgi:hypothetical protein